jgi:hypothetical protein
MITQSLQPDKFIMALIELEINKGQPKNNCSSPKPRLAVKNPIANSQLPIANF